MCNACGFLCCAYDGFSHCGCDCENPKCWDRETYEREFGDADEFDSGELHMEDDAREERERNESSLKARAAQ